ncbi:MAG: class I SAM-dependent methyltransferase [Acidobacteriota bacterium]
MAEGAATARLEAGSFRDRDGRVFYRDGRVYRALSEEGLEDWKRLAATRFFPRMVEAGKIVPTETADLPPSSLESLPGPWVAALEHERIPFVTYPYEWCFSMLRDAALLQLELVAAALDEDLIPKDATSYNVQWRGCRPVFIDTASFENLAPGDPWVGYLQFCRLFLYPLLLTAHLDIPFHPWMRGDLEGPTPAAMSAVFGSWRRRLKPGVLRDVYLQAKLQAGAAEGDAAVRGELREAGFPKELIVANVKRLQGLVDRLRWRREHSEWAAYDGDNTYDSEARGVKEQFVADVAAERHRKLVWDLGANTGRYSLLAAAHADRVVAFDADHLAIERLYRRLRKEGPDNVLPLVMNLAAPSPGLGWRHGERASLGERPSPDLVLALALIHHVVIGAHVPLPDFVAWLGDLGADLVIEFVTKDDPMVKRLLRNKADRYHDYEPEVFEACLAERFEIVRREGLPSGTRTLYHARPRSLPTSP